MPNAGPSESAPIANDDVPVLVWGGPVDDQDADVGVPVSGSGWGVARLAVLAAGPTWLLDIFVLLRHCTPSLILIIIFGRAAPQYTKLLLTLAD